MRSKRVGKGLKKNERIAKEREKRKERKGKKKRGHKQEWAGDEV